MAYAHPKKLGSGVLHQGLKMRLYLRIHQPQSYPMLSKNEHVIKIGHYNGQISISLHLRIQRVVVDALDKFERVKNVA